MGHFNRNVAIVGVGRTRSTSRRPDVDQPELVKEAVSAALEDAGLTFKDIDVNVIGDMELFQGDYQSDMWHVAGYGGKLKPGMRITTGGTTGGTLVLGAVNYVASEMFDVALAVGFQKHDEGNASTGLTSGEGPLWTGWTAAGVPGSFAENMVKRFGSRVEKVVNRIRVQAAENSLRNPYSHLKQELTEEDVEKSPYISAPMRLLHLCPQSNAACAVIVASEKRAKEISPKPVWIKDFVTSHWEESSVKSRAAESRKSTHRDAAEKIYKRNGITEPLKQIDLFEMYDPSAWYHLNWLMEFFMLEPEQVFEMVENGVTAYDGAFPVNPSGGVLSSNPIGASAMLRTAEAALQIRGDAGPHQVKKPVRTAMASSFGGSGWTILTLLSDTPD